MRALGAFCLGLCPSTALKQKVNRREKIVNTHSNDIVISFKLLPKLQADSRKSKRNIWPGLCYHEKLRFLRQWQLLFVRSDNLPIEEQAIP